MKKSDKYITASDGKELFFRVWNPEGNPPKAAVLIVHGMVEHSGRYDRFAEFLTGHGIAVAAYDHRGHGKTDPEHLGLIRGDDGFHLMVSDLEFAINESEKQFPEIPLFLFAHSMGSFLTQRYVQIHDTEIAGVIYSGSNGKPPALLYGGLFLSKLIRIAKGPDHQSKLIENLTFGPYNAMFKPNRTEHDWLSRDTEEVDKYTDDPHCGFRPSVSFFHDLFNGLMTLHNHTPFAGSSPDIPILIISGNLDPVSYMGEGIKRLEKQLRESGAEHLEVKLYTNARHELLNEINRDVVMKDVYAWIESVLEV